MKWITGIHFDATTEELEEALPFTKGKWKPITVPFIKKEDLKPGSIKMIEVSQYKWKPALPYTNHLKDKKL